MDLEDIDKLIDQNQSIVGSFSDDTPSNSSTSKELDFTRIYSLMRKKIGKMTNFFKFFYTLMISF